MKQKKPNEYEIHMIVEGDVSKEYDELEEEVKQTIYNSSYFDFKQIKEISVTGYSDSHIIPGNGWRTEYIVGEITGCSDSYEYTGIYVLYSSLRDNRNRVRDIHITDIATSDGIAHVSMHVEDITVVHTTEIKEKDGGYDQARKVLEDIMVNHLSKED